MKTRVIGNVRVGKADVNPSLPSHVRGVREGNRSGRTRKERGIVPLDGQARGTAARSTGINADEREPILPGMPNLSPS